MEAAELIHHPSVGLAEALAEALDARDRYTAGTV